MSLAVKNLYAGYGKKTIISNINFEVGPGKICALMGRNGSGKTTLLRCINGVIKPLKGKVFLNDKNVASFSRDKIARIVSVVPQTSASAFSFSCLDMVLMASVSRLKAWGSPSKKDMEKAFDVLKEAGVEHLAPRPFNAVSGGERQLILLARGLFQDTPIMLLDEPNSHLDFTNQHKIMSLMKKLVKKRNMSVVITLHDPNLTHYYCDEVIMLKNGKALAKGDIKEIMTDELLSQALGGNIQCDVTTKGVFVVTPKQLTQNTITP